jgi:hypothetical protein
MDPAPHEMEEPEILGDAISASPTLTLSPEDVERFALECEPGQSYTGTDSGHREHL